ncbi:MAG: nucleotide exchange factor GrpE [Intrasporangiaceae bacterium]|nr:nucleotide exchange factor GrpE [Intrasporangiaceae bacterium]
MSPPPGAGEPVVPPEHAADVSEVPQPERVRSTARTGSDRNDGPEQADGGGDDLEEAAAEETLDLETLADADPRSRAELYGALLAAEAQRDEYLDDLRRARAEFDNYRRRVMREGASQRDSGKAEAFGSLLEVLDDLERTVEASEGSDDPSLAKGLQLVASKLVSAVGSQGLTRIDAVDAPFDPNEHEAVQQLPSDEPTDEPVVTQVLRPGYRLGDRVLRPAMVVVRS